MTTSFDRQRELIDKETTVDGLKSIAHSLCDDLEAERATSMVNQDYETTCNDALAQVRMLKAKLQHYQEPTLWGVIKAWFR